MTREVPHTHTHTHTHKQICSSHSHRTRQRPPTHRQTKIATIRRTQPSFIWDVVTLALWRRINTSSRRAKRSGELTRLEKQRDSDGVCVCVFVSCCKMPLRSHTCGHTHTYWPSVGTLVDRWWCHCLLLSNYQVHYPCNMPVMCVFFLFCFFFPLCVFVCRLGCEGAFIKAATVNKKHNLPRNRSVFSCHKPPPPVADPLCTFYFFFII